MAESTIERLKSALNKASSGQPGAAGAAARPAAARAGAPAAPVPRQAAAAARPSAAVPAARSVAPSRPAAQPGPAAASKPAGQARPAVQAKAAAPSRPAAPSKARRADKPPAAGTHTQTRLQKARSLFERDSIEAIDEQTPRGGRMIIYLALACVTVLLVWAASADIEEVARGDGKIVPSRNVQMVQSLDGGVVAEIMVREGARVTRDQPLVRIEAVRADSQKAESVSRQLSLQARAARLEAEASGSSTLRFADGLQRDAADTVQREQAVFDARRREHAASLRVIDGQITQRIEEAREATTRRDAAMSTLALLQREYDVTKPLARTGAVSEIELVRLERELVRTRGETASGEATISRLAAALNEARQRRQEVEETFRSKARQELTEASNELGRLGENARGLDDRVSKTVLRSPVDGVVKTLHTRSVGGVVQPGKEVVEIVPSDDALVIEARIQPRDIARLHVGQPAIARLSAYDFAIYGGLPAKVSYIGADTLQDDKGNAYYLVHVRTDKSDDSQAIGNPERPILPGMTASVDIVTGKRTVLTYLLKPILRARQRAFTER